MKNTKTQYEAACDIASKVYAGELTAANGKALLSDQFGLNETSANDYILVYRKLMKGEFFLRGMGKLAMRHFIEQIHAKHGDAGLGQALQSLHSHIESEEKRKGSAMPSMRAIAEEFGHARAPSDLAEIKISFDLRVTQSLRDTKTARLHRLSRTEKIPREISVQTKIFLRNPDVVAEVLLRAAGICERCKHAAPFFRIKDGTPYLEVHHKKLLANGGEDSVENAIAVCPNCHRAVHYGPTNT